MGHRVPRLLTSYEAFNRRDFTAAFAMLASDVEWSATLGGPVLRGERAVREFWSSAQVSVDWHPEPGELLQSGPRIFAIVHQRVRDAASNVVDDRRVAHVVTFRGEEVIRLEAFNSLDDGLRALFGS
jgi:ketosteroid isomerase-like protein